ncbi:hypothetical protein UCD39_13540 [Nitrospirillum sp. BR 11752]|uniref:hypothetical protein n=1 Tax=Nitrospirillum sp. BR 11752 TaxID=3104293 RepID=UPI002EB98E07|nr:hypothetical protein [Nitrospirillum sp. BR 11752]
MVITMFASKYFTKTERERADNDYYQAKRDAADANADFMQRLVMRSAEEGRYAQVVALRAELARLDPGNPLLQPTEKEEYLADGSRRTILRQVFDRAFDAFMMRHGVKNPAKHRG